MTRWQVVAALVLSMTAITHASTPEALPCLHPVADVQWLRWEENQQTLDLWCQTVGPPVLVTAASQSGGNGRLLIVSWNVAVGGAEVERLLAPLLTDASNAGAGLVLLLQETFRGGVQVPDTYPDHVHVPSAIRPNRPTLDVVGIAKRFGLSVAYVPSMRNGAASTLEMREDRGNAVLSTEPLSDIRAIELPFGKQRRVAVAATVTLRRTTTTSMRVVTTHFDTNSARVAQAEALGQRIAALDDLPLIVAGDFNARRGFNDDAVAAIRDRISLESCGTNRTNRWPLRLDVPFFFLVGRLDFLFSTLETSTALTCQTLNHAYGSDHLPILLDVQFP
jgi:endonuclease/exonuclease/phosphatase family metal-dependent hydrolase